MLDTELFLRFMFNLRYNDGISFYHIPESPFIFFQFPFRTKQPSFPLHQLVDLALLVLVLDLF